jgi:hypothetical protein
MPRRSRRCSCCRRMLPPNSKGRSAEELMRRASAPERILTAKHDDSAHQRRACISSNHEAAYGMEPSRRPVVPRIQGQVEGAENPRAGARTDTPENQTVSATALLEQRAVSPRADRRCEAFGHAPAGQSGASPAKKQSEWSAGRADPAPSGRRQDERLRLWTPVPRRRQDDLLGSRAARNSFRSWTRWRTSSSRNTSNRAAGNCGRRRCRKLHRAPRNREP